MAHQTVHLADRPADKISNGTPINDVQNQSANEIAHYLRLACNEAINAVESNKGGPFGAIVVKDGAVIARAHNMVLDTNDPTAHAEITAIRQATAKLGTFKLDGCILYSSCHPCPMCFGACLWARLEKVYYACTEEDAAGAGFDDSHFYKVILDEERRRQFAIAAPVEGGLYPMQVWNKKHDRVMY